ncbi:MAG TPA: TIGR01212 family radical SAM protein [Bdellovibrionota bacterium]|nr:TIGR01212 family radical SAM protein [Bdellovibrionota bacterium]
MEPFYSYSSYLQSVFGERAYKVVVAAGLTCPTRDGSLGKKGCAFCDVRGSSSYFGKLGRSRKVQEQIEARMPGVRDRYGVSTFLAYFQSYTNTYADVDYLREIYRAALSAPGIRGLCVGTRPDCLPDPVLDLLEELAREHYVSLELGVQSFHDETLLWLERGHDRACSLEALVRLRERAPSVHVCAHLIFGSPTEPAGTPAEAARLLNASGVKGAKLHQLMVLKGTELERRYLESPFPTLSVEEYSVRVGEFLDHLDPSIYVERLSAKASHRDEIVAPEWSRDHWGPHNRIRELLAARGVTQGRMARAD